MECCRDCKHYRYRDDRCYLGSDKYDCVDFEPQDIDDDFEDDEVEETL